jgi:hypothetical protein
MAKDDPGRQPFFGSVSVNGAAGSSGLGEFARVPPKKILVVEAVSAVAVMSIPGLIETTQINSPFTLFMIPVLVSDGPSICGDMLRRIRSASMPRRGGRSSSRSDRSAPAARLHAQ